MVGALGALFLGLGSFQSLCILEDRLRRGRIGARLRLVKEAAVLTPLGDVGIAANQALGIAGFWEVRGCAGQAGREEVIVTRHGGHGRPGQLDVRGRCPLQETRWSISVVVCGVDSRRSPNVAQLGWCGFGFGFGSGLCGACGLLWLRGLWLWGFGDIGVFFVVEVGRVREEAAVYRLGRNTHEEPRHLQRAYKGRHDGRGLADAPGGAGWCGL
jgi:hypothetical protein